MRAGPEGTLDQVLALEVLRVDQPLVEVPLVLVLRKFDARADPVSTHDDEDSHQDHEKQQERSEGASLAVLVGLRGLCFAHEFSSIVCGGGKLQAAIASITQARCPLPRRQCAYS